MRDASIPTPLDADGAAQATPPPPLKIWTPLAADLGKDLPTYANLSLHCLYSLAWLNRKCDSDRSSSGTLAPSLRKVPHPRAVDVCVCGVPRYSDMCKHFNWHWRLRHPVVVREIKPGVSWRPVVMESAMKETGASTSPEEWLHVLDCQDGGMGEQLEMEHEDFFKCVVVPAARAIPVSVHVHSRDSV